MTLRRTLALAVVLPLLLAGCAETEANREPDPARMFESEVDVDTPELRALKKKAGVEQCRPGRATGPAEDSLPDVTLPCLGGGPDVNLNELRGPLVINLWAQWCGPCRAELPFYQRLHEAAGDQVKVIGIDYQDTRPAAALQLIEQTGVTYPLLADPQAKVRVPFRVRGLPGAVFVDVDGRVTAVEYVVIESYDQLRGLVDEHLGVTVP